MMGELIDDPFRAARLVLSLRREGITDHGVLNVIERISRAGFVDARFKTLADEDCELPLACGQTQHRPSAIARALQALELVPGDAMRILLLGEESGYMAALLAELGHHVYVVSRYHTLVEHIRQSVSDRTDWHVRVTHGDLSNGWPSASPFDRIVMLSGIEEIDFDLRDQLSSIGFCLGAIETGEGHSLQKIDAKGAMIRAFGPIKTVQFTPGASSVL